MTTTETIVQQLMSLPESAQQEVLRFVEFLESRQGKRVTPEDEIAWAEFSLASAMRGMEDEESPYTLADLRETFR
ncbi:MAG: DUF2281 domain-containing protein [bacterium]